MRNISTRTADINARHVKTNLLMITTESAKVESVNHSRVTNSIDLSVVINKEEDKKPTIKSAVKFRMATRIR